MQLGQGPDLTGVPMGDLSPKQSAVAPSTPVTGLFSGTKQVRDTRGVGEVAKRQLEPDTSFRGLMKRFSLWRSSRSGQRSPDRAQQTTQSSSASESPTSIKDSRGFRAVKAICRTVTGFFGRASKSASTPEAPGPRAPLHSLIAPKPNPEEAEPAVPHAEPAPEQTPPEEKFTPGGVEPSPSQSPDLILTTEPLKPEDIKRLQAETGTPQELPYMDAAVKGIDEEMTEEQKVITKSAYTKAYRETYKYLGKYNISEGTKVAISDGIGIRAAIRDYDNYNFEKPISTSDVRYDALDPPKGAGTEYFMQLARVVRQKKVPDKDLQEVATTLSKILDTMFAYAKSKKFSQQDAIVSADETSRYFLSHWDEVDTQQPLLVELSNIYANEYLDRIYENMSDEAARGSAEIAAERFRDARETLKFSYSEATVYMQAYANAESSDDTTLKAMGIEERDYYNKNFAIGCVLAERQAPPITDFGQRVAFGRSYATMMGQLKLDQPKKRGSVDLKERERRATEFARDFAQRFLKS